MTHEELIQLVLDMWVAFGPEQGILGRKLTDRIALALDGIPDTAAVDFVGALAEARERLAYRRQQENEAREAALNH